MTADDEPGKHFPYRYQARLAPMWLAYRVWPGGQGVTVTDDGRLIARYGPFRVDAPLSQIQDAHITGPYRWWTPNREPHFRSQSRRDTILSPASRWLEVRARETGARCQSSVSTVPGACFKRFGRASALAPGIGT